MLYSLGSYVDRHVIITRDRGEHAPERNNVTVVTPERPMRGLRYWWWASGVVKELVEASPEFRWLVHEHVIGVSTFFLERRMQEPPPTLVSVYAAEVSFLRDRAWNVDPHADSLGVTQHFYYLYRYARKSVVHFFSWLDADIITANSQKVADDVDIYFPNRRVHVVPSAIDVDTIVDHEVADDSVRWDGDGLKLLFVGDLHTFKGIGTMLKAFRGYLDSGGEAQFLLVGGQYEVDEAWLDRCIRSRGVEQQVRRTGLLPRSAVMNLYPRADALIFPSFHEGSPRVVKEALCCGCPVIASDIAGVRIIDPDGEAVRYVEPGDVEGFTEAIAAAERWPEDRQAYARTARDIVTCFTPDRIAARFADIYETLWANQERHFSTTSVETP